MSDWGFPNAPLPPRPRWPSNTWPPSPWDRVIAPCTPTGRFDMVVGSKGGRFFLERCVASKQCAGGTQGHALAELRPAYTSGADTARR